MQPFDIDDRWACGALPVGRPSWAKYCQIKANRETEQISIEPCVTGPARYEAENKKEIWSWKTKSTLLSIYTWLAVAPELWFSCWKSRYNSDGSRLFHCFRCWEHLGRRRGTEKVTPVKIFNRARAHLAQKPLCMASQHKSMTSWPS